MPSVFCFECGAEISFVDKLSRQDECPKCRADARVCKNCQFYDSKVYNECKETQADPIREKNRSNLCDFFSPRQDRGGSGAEKDKAAALRAAAEALFKKS